MNSKLDRRQFLKLAGIGGVVFASGMGGFAEAAKTGTVGKDFFFVQLSDTHWGFKDEKVNPDWQGTLKKAVAAVNDLESPPAFIVFTGDLSHTTDDPKERRNRLSGFRDIAAGLKAGNIRYMPGEHDASLDNGEAFKEFFGPTRYTFDHEGVHFIALDNVSDPTSSIGDAQLAWLADDLRKLDPETMITVLTHRPLFDLYPQWDWATRDGAKAIELLTPFRNVTVFYGHIHQEHHRMTGNIPHHAARGLMYPLPEPGSVPKKAPIPWDPAHPYKGLGFREPKAIAGKSIYSLQEYPIR
ncbi:MAG TPA: metallophosphoesterase [Candidatus Deferrimicrobiaceae bacterium]|jgi:hypothetical protein